MSWAKIRASPIMHKHFILLWPGLRSRIGAVIVARLANSQDIACIERLAITDSASQRTRVSLC
jgi:hypothetical protein